MEWLRWFLCVALISLGSACVTKRTYEDLKKENQLLEKENADLHQDLMTAQQKLNAPEPGEVIPTDNQRLAIMLSKLVNPVLGQEGSWQINYHGIPMLVLTSEAHNRMRIMTVLDEKGFMERSQLKTLMEANFDRALDARYALFQEKLWSVYLHPLNTLTETEFDAAVEQVANLVNTYGTTYSSGQLQFR